MEHITETRITELVLDELQQTVDESAHLAECAQCREHLAAYQALNNDLEVYRASEVSADALTRYDALFEEVQRAPGPVAAVWQGIRAVLAWDGRTAAAGVRNASADGYRLLYTAAEHDIELMVESAGTHRTVTGDVLLAEPVVEPILIELFAYLADATEQAPETDEPIHVGEINVDGTGVNEYIVEATDGQFRLDGVLPGTYVLMATPSHGDPLVITSLAIT